MTSDQIIQSLRQQANPSKARVLQGFFKTGPGEYGEGDVFWGLTVPQTRKVAKFCKDIPLKEIPSLLKHPVHEVRMCAVLLMVDKYSENPEEIFACYIKSARFINNWDLVDLSADKIVGRHLDGRDKSLLSKLARSENIWERRIAIVATFHEIKQGRPETTFKIAEMLLDDDQDLIHKAAGWMLREGWQTLFADSGRKISKKHAAYMPRTMLRYAIERFSQDKKKYYMNREA